MTDLTPLAILEAARAKIADPSNWGKKLRGIDRPRCTFCAAETIEDLNDELSLRPRNANARKLAFVALYNAAGLDYDDDLLVDWNDAPERTHAEVMAAFNLAIATLRM